MADELFWVVAKRLAGRSGPEVDPWDLPAIRKAGIHTIVSADDQCDPASIEAAGMKHLPKYMPSSYPTNDALVDRFVNLVRDATVSVLEELNQGRNVLVHCYAGRDRSGLILATTLMEFKKISAEDALLVLKSVRPTALTGPGVFDVLSEYEIRLNAGAF